MRSQRKAYSNADFARVSAKDGFAARESAKVSWNANFSPREPGEACWNSDYACASAGYEKRSSARKLVPISGGPTWKISAMVAAMSARLSRWASRTGAIRRLDQ